MLNSQHIENNHHILMLEKVWYHIYQKHAEAAAKKEAKQFEKETAPNPDKAATKLQKVMRGKITRNKISNEIGQMETQIAGIENLVQTSKRLKRKHHKVQQIFLI